MVISFFWENKDNIKEKINTVIKQQKEKEEAWVTKNIVNYLFQFL